MTLTYHDILTRLEGVKTNGNGHAKALCPAHEDTNPSLSVAKGKTRPVVFHCYAGCTEEAILKAMGLTLEDVTEPKQDIEAVYDYTDADGELRFQVVRKPNKKFLQRRPRWRRGLDLEH